MTLSQRLQFLTPTSDCTMRLNPKPRGTHGSSGFCIPFSIHPMSDQGDTLAMTLPFISASGSGP